MVCLFTFKGKFLSVIDLFLNSSSPLFSIAANLNSLFSSNVILQASFLLSMEPNSAKIYGSDFQYDNLTPKKSGICPTFYWIKWSFCGIPETSKFLELIDALYLLILLAILI